MRTFQHSSVQRSAAKALMAPAVGTSAVPSRAFRSSASRNACPSSFGPFSGSASALRLGHICRFRAVEAAPSIDEQTSQERFVGDADSKRHGPVVLALDTSRAEAKRALQYVIDNVCQPGDSLELVHVVCDPRGLGTAVATGARGPSAGYHMERGTEYEAVKAEAHMSQLLGVTYDRILEQCGQILRDCDMPYQIHLPRLLSPRSASVIGETLLAEAERLQARCLVIASHGPGALAEYGSVARYCYQHATRPLMLIPSDINAITEQPAVATEAATETSVPTAAPQQATGTAMEALPQAAQGVPHSVREATPSAQPSQDSQGATQATQQQWLAMPKAAPRQVLLLVENLHELEHHWQWVADNICRKGDVLRVWQLTRMGREGRDMPHPSHDAALASLPTALVQVLKRRGLSNAEFITKAYEETGEVAAQVASASVGPEPPSAVVVLNYVRKGYIWESLQGSVASELARHCPVPLVLLQPPV